MVISGCFLQMSVYGYWLVFSADICLWLLVGVFCRCLFMVISGGFLQKFVYGY